MYFHTLYEQYPQRQDQPCTILHVLPDEEQDPEVGALYRIRFEDGEEIDAWAHEIVLGTNEFLQFLAPETLKQALADIATCQEDNAWKVARDAVMAEASGFHRTADEKTRFASFQPVDRR